MQIPCCVPRTAKHLLKMNNLRPCNDTFCSENGPKKGHFGLKTAKTIEKRRLEGNKVKNHKHKVTKCKLLVVARALQRVYWKRTTSVRAITLFVRKSVLKRVILA